MEFLRGQRLQAVKRDLEKATPITTITELATQWGFAHLGRFSQLYATQFGEKPSATLGRSLRNGVARAPDSERITQSLWAGQSCEALLA